MKIQLLLLIALLIVSTSCLRDNTDDEFDTFIDEEYQDLNFIPYDHSFDSAEVARQIKGLWQLERILTAGATTTWSLVENDSLFLEINDSTLVFTQQDSLILATRWQLEQDAQGSYQLDADSLGSSSFVDGNILYTANYLLFSSNQTTSSDFYYEKR